MADLQAVADNLIKGKAQEVQDLVKQALDEGVPPGDVLNQGLIAGMHVVGKKFKANEFYVPEVLIAARAMKFGMEILQPGLEAGGVKPVAKIAIGTVKGDLHDIGKNLVAMMFRGGGFEVVDLLIDAEADAFVNAAKEGCELICMSALLTTTMPQMSVVIKAIKEAKIDGVKTMVGGAPLTQEYADEIGADGYAADAASAVERARELLGVG